VRHRRRRRAAAGEDPPPALREIRDRTTSLQTTLRRPQVAPLNCASVIAGPSSTSTGRSASGVDELTDAPVEVGVRSAIPGRSPGQWLQSRPEDSSRRPNACAPTPATFTRRQRRRGSTWRFSERT
jgi:hypothetical protein